MKLKFYIFETKSPSWVEAARAEYANKLRGFVDFELAAPPFGDFDDGVNDRRDVGTRRHRHVLIAKRHV